MAASQMTVCSSRQVLEGAGGAGVALSARKSSCFCGGTTKPSLAWHRYNHRDHHRHELVQVRAQDAKKGTRLFRFNKKEGSEPSEPAAPGPGTRLFRFGAKKQAVQEEEEAGTSKFGTQIFKNLGNLGKKEAGRGGALVPVKQTSLAFSLPNRRQDPKTVFVTGATGQIGARIVQKLLGQGLNVRAGVRDLFVAQQLAEFATQYGVVSREDAKRLNAVEFDFKNVESIAKAVGGAGKVVLTIGPAEDGPKSKVSFEDASNVVEAAKLANVASLVVVYEASMGGAAGADENPLSGLASFFSELFSKPYAVSLSELIDQIVDSDVSYTLLKIAATDDTSSAAQNVELQKEGTPVLSENSKVSKAQVASIVAEVLINPAAAENKVVEVFTSATAAAVPIANLLSAIQVDGRREAKAAARAQAAEEEREKAAREKAEADARAAVEEARKASQLAAQLEAEAKQLAAEEAKAASLVERAQAQAAAAAASVDSLASRIKELPGPQQLLAKAGAGAKAAAGPASFSLPAFPNFSPALASKSPPKSRPAPAPQPKKPVSREPAPSRSPPPASKPEVNSIFGGLFSQETVYVDEV